VKSNAGKPREPDDSASVSDYRSELGESRGEDDEGGTDSRGLGRVLALSDGVFAIAITLLVFNLTSRPSLYSAGFSKTMRELGPQFQGAAISFVVIGMLWLGHHRTFSYIRRVDRCLLQLNLLSLAPIVFMPFAAQLLAEYGNQAAEGTMLYAATVAAASLCYLAVWGYAVRNRHLTAKTLSDSAIQRCVLRPFVTFVVFGLSIPISIISPTSAHVVWLAVLIFLLFVGDPNRSSSKGEGVRISSRPPGRRGSR
jgi:uncharacterized membrane protein